MCKDRSVHCTLIYKVDGLACQIIQAVDVLFGMLDGNLGARLLDPQHGLEHDARAVLNELTDGMQVGGEIR